MANSLSLSAKQYKVLTWMDDVDGLTNVIEGNELVIFYALDRDFFEQRIPMSEVADTIHNILDFAA